jgi:hypothetical protein
MQTIINKVVDDPYDITYIAIGSAHIRNSNKAKDRQQFPPFLEAQYNSNKKIRIINIDPCFEKPYFMKKYLPYLIEDKLDNLDKQNTDIEKIDDNNKIDRLYNENIEVYYIKITINFNEDKDLYMLNLLNQIIMNQTNILIVGDFTGRSNNFLELYFYNLYKNTEYQIKFNNLICYDFVIDCENSCQLNVETNYPIIENDKIIKFNFINEDDFLIKIKNKKLNIIHKRIFTNSFKKFINTNLYIYRNLISKNISHHIINIIQESIFNDIDINEIKDVEARLIDKLILYDEIINILYHKEKYLFDIIGKVNIIDNYKLYNDLIKLNYELINCS